MKLSNLFLFLIGIIYMSGCSSAGFQRDAMADIVTPGVSPQTSVRTWDESNKPTEQKVENDPAYLYDSERDKK